MGVGAHARGDRSAMTIARRPAFSLAMAWFAMAIWVVAWTGVFTYIYLTWDGV